MLQGQPRSTEVETTLIGRQKPAIRSRATKKPRREERIEMMVIECRLTLASSDGGGLIAEESGWRDAKIFYCEAEFDGFPDAIEEFVERARPGCGNRAVQSHWLRKNPPNLVG